jgi:hypothetical protein
VDKQLESLGVDTKRNTSELKDKQTNSDLVEAIKQELWESISKVIVSDGLTIWSISSAT